MDNNNNINNGQPVQPQYQPQPVQPQAPYQQSYQQQPYQQPVQYSAPQYVDPLMVPADEMTQEEKRARRKAATILCIISLALHVLPSIISGVLTGISESLSSLDSLDVNSVGSIMGSLYSFAFGGSYIASWVLLIIARVKYKESKFAKILMWVYIGLLAAGIIGIIILFLMCAYMLKDCQGF